MDFRILSSSLLEDDKDFEEISSRMNFPILHHLKISKKIDFEKIFLRAFSGF